MLMKIWRESMRRGRSKGFCFQWNLKTNSKEENKISKKS
jgi:hypothetical protein